VADAALLDAVRAMATRRGTTPRPLFLAAWAVVLSRHSGEQDVVFGDLSPDRRKVPTSGPVTAGELRGELWPVRARGDGERTVAELLDELHDQERARETPSSRATNLAEESPLPWETVVVVESIDDSFLDPPGSPAQPAVPGPLSESLAAPLIVKVSAGERLAIELSFDPHRYRAATVERLALGWLQALGELTTGEHSRLADISVLSPGELFTIRERWNDTGRPFPEELLVHQLFEAQARRYPELAAVEYGGRAISYREVDQRSNAVAAALRAEGVAPGMFVAVCLERGPELVVAMLATLKAGAVYVPLDPRYPAERLALMLSELAVVVVVTDGEHRPLFGAARCLCLEGDEPIDERGGKALAAPPDPGAGCCVFFTSGSTGVPNGVLVGHRAIVNTLDWVNRTFGVSAGDRLLFVTSPSFDLSLYDVFGALGAGATVVIASSELLRDPPGLARAIVDDRITIWNSAPAALSQLVPYFARGGAPPCLRLVLLSGDWIPLSLPDDVRSAFPGASVISLGGATEAAIWSNWFPIGPIDPRWTSIPYGRPIQNCRYYVLDKALRSVPVGVTGDLYIAGTCLAEGYLNRPALTAERFVQDPTPPHQRLYRTGDLARYFDDGNLEFLGRNDFQVKIRGFRIELAEVEAALTALEPVREAVCLAQRDRSAQMALIAYVVPHRGAIVSPRAIRENLAARLPAFMVPSRVAVLAELPLSTNGKVDRKALGQMALSTTSEGIPPRTARESQIAALWEDLFDRRPIGVTDDFFDLGGHSLLAVMLVSRLKTELGLEVSLDQLLQRPTVEGLARPGDGESTEDGAPARFLEFNRTGSRPPLVLFPGIFGTVLIYRELPGLLGPDQPLLMALAPEAATEDARRATIEGLAARYEEELLRRLPAGPVVLGGFSFGATLALEVFHRLRRRGRQLPLVISIDGAAPGYPDFLPPLARAAAHLSYFRGATGEERRDYVRYRLDNARRRLYRAMGREHELSAEVLTATPEMKQRLERVWRFHHAALSRYRPTFEEQCSLLLIRAAESYRLLGVRTDSKLLGWRLFAKEPIQLLTLPGGHEGLFSGANAPRIVTAIAAAIDAHTAGAERVP